ncbi:MAG: hypothetical protein WA704_14190 [Pseudolabrys sp.]|jgi:hypothetical protein
MRRREFITLLAGAEPWNLAPLVVPLQAQCVFPPEAGCDFLNGSCVEVSACSKNVFNPRAAGTSSKQGSENR